MIHTLVAEAAKARPEATALISETGATLSYDALWSAIEDLSDTLGRAGLGPGERLLIVAENAPQTVALIFAASVLGAVAVPVNARMTAAELTRITAHAAPRLMAYTTDISPDARAHATTAQAQPVESPAGPLMLARAVPAGAPSDAPAPDAACPDPACPDPDCTVILYTTGTTGDPKGVTLTHKNLIFAGHASARLRRMQARDLIYGVLPMTHVFGLASILMAATSIGAAIRLEARFSAAKLRAALQDGVTVFPGVPQMHAHLMADIANPNLSGQNTTGQNLPKLNATALRYVSAGGAPLDPAWKRKAEAFYGLPLQNGYGMTESTAGVCATDLPIGHPDVSCGPPLPGVEVRLDTSVPAATDPGVGEVLTRGPHVMAGYYRNPKATAEALTPDGWLRTGDLGRLDDSGALHIVGRAKELIIRGGFNVYPPEVEAALNDHPAVTQAAVVGRALPGGDEEILAFVQCAAPETLDPAALETFLVGRLAPYKRPGQIIVAKTLPAAPSGKVLKHRLTQHFADRLRAP